MGLLADSTRCDLPSASDALLIALNDGRAPEGRAAGEAVTGEESRAVICGDAGSEQTCCGRDASFLQLVNGAKTP